MLTLLTQCTVRESTTSNWSLATLVNNLQTLSPLHLMPCSGALNLVKTQLRKELKNFSKVTHYTIGYIWHETFYFFTATLNLHSWASNKKMNG